VEGGIFAAGSKPASTTAAAFPTLEDFLVGEDLQ